MQSRIAATRGDRGEAVIQDDVDMRKLELSYVRDLLAAYDRLEREIDYSPKTVRRLVTELGGVEASRRLLSGGPGQAGLDRLWEHQRLDQSLEAHVIMPEYAPLFTESERRKARRRLEDHGFDVATFLKSLDDES